MRPPLIAPTRRGLIQLLAASASMPLIGLSRAQGEPSPTVLVSLSKASEPFMRELRTQAEEEAAKLNLKLIFQDGKGDSAVQAAALDAAIAGGGIDAVLLAPNDLYSLAPSVNQALKKKLPVMTLDRRMLGTSQPIPHVGANNVAGGQLLAQWVVQQFPRGANVLHLTGQPGSSSAIDRAKGVRDAFAAAGPQYRLVADVSADWSRAEALTVTEKQLTLLKTLPDAIVAGNDDMALGALEAISVLRLQGRGIRVIGYDALPFALEQVRRGTLGATVDQHGDQISRLALQRIAANLRKNEPLESISLTPTLISPDVLRQRDTKRAAATQ